VERRAENPLSSCDLFGAISSSAFPARRTRDLEEQGQIPVFDPLHGAIRGGTDFNLPRLRAKLVFRGV
jgi:hypothetical protein